MEMRNLVIGGIVLIVIVLGFVLFGKDDGPETSQESASPHAIQQE
ncbi:hypothetical protein [Falsirhodobacter sp. 20TX0035]|nr:hypothetical protein [Falsirhodobacter sp. 20TX0035]MDB6454545.1 hypothetical protein [Falsirhodobacter sp. 20TX0035]